MSGSSESSAFDLLDFHERAVRTASHESPDAMRDLVVETLTDAGHPPDVDDAGNVVVSRGTGEHHIVLNTHLDTVPPHVPFERVGEPPNAEGDAPSDPEGDVVLGRGACDAKGPLAALLDAFLHVDPPGRLTLALTPDEETTSAGAHALDLDGDCYVVGEPTDLAVCTAAKGRFEGTVTVEGAAAHAAHPEDGVNATAAMEAVLAALRTFDAEHGPGTHEQLGAPTLTPTVLAGGEAANQLPERATVTVDRRSVPPETATGYERALNEHLEAHVAAGPVPDAAVAFGLTERPTPFLDAFATPTDHSLVRTFEEAGAGDSRPFTAATEASYFAPAPVVVFGPGVLVDDVGPVAHARREYVRRSDVERAAAILRTVLSGDPTSV
ncbi:M20/M25/M40 family metallo-hydrolase [Halomarina oriensis]|uniref:M20/M25/M40 family metallo-hydrolase n=1 Tax=Halomarina oriensis TaxID=671145 RepID=A0A6B0GU09_9EURY|nr:M20/M25/M40 family metallo-hydrolase [Halomarina oriensis]MWG35198.1 M20/M25/M40 family metallo-hydrolase [Halomarina oriensis]